MIFYTSDHDVSMATYYSTRLAFTIKVTYLVTDFTGIYFTEWVNDISNRQNTCLNAYFIY